MTAKKVQLSDNKSEAMVVYSNRMFNRSPLPFVIYIIDADFTFVFSVKNADDTLDSGQNDFVCLLRLVRTALSSHPLNIFVHLQHRLC